MSQVETTPMSCCSGFYEQDWVREWMGDSFHPGGEALTSALVASANLPEGSRVLDLGCGAGTSAMLLAREFNLDVTGIDRSMQNLELARQRAGRAGLTIEFSEADAHDLPLENDCFDLVLCECVFSLLGDAEQALDGVKRVLKPGGLFLVSDMAVTGALPEDLAGVVEPWTCLMDARTEDEFRALFDSAGFRLHQFNDASSGLSELLGRLKRKLLVAGTGSLVAGLDFDVEKVRRLLDRFGEEISAGRIRYLAFVLETPAPDS